MVIFLNEIFNNSTRCERTFVHLLSCLDLETDQKYSVCVLAATKAGVPKLNKDRWPWVSQVVSENSRVGGKVPSWSIHFVRCGFL